MIQRTTTCCLATGLANIEEKGYLTRRRAQSYGWMMMQDSLVISSVDQTPDHQSLEGIFIVEMERAQVHQLPSYLRLVS
ncbi:hypothetical protein ZWY2020_033835 [Hordeum vulgare]|nr:hypothetical protein ZWY2020_033835 [Hordeum vulgare]